MAKIILDLCGGTGSWSKPYRDAGYDVRVITLPRYSLFDTRERERLIQFYNRDEMVMEEVNADEVYGIFAAPTCTMFSLARTTAKPLGILRVPLNLLASVSRLYGSVERPMNHSSSFGLWKIRWVT